MNEMGKRINRMRLECGLTMAELAEKLHVQPSAVNKWEKGTVENIKRSTIEEMASIFNVSPVWLMGFDPEPATLAAHFEGEEYTQEEIEKIVQFAHFLKATRKDD